MADAFDQIQWLANKLLTLEVNTILKDHIQGTSMPSTVDALVEIEREYADKLSEFEPPKAPGAPDADKPHPPMKAQFDELYVRAANARDVLTMAIAAMENAPAAAADRSERGAEALRADLLLVGRIQDNCRSISEIIDRYVKRQGATPMLTEEHPSLFVRFFRSIGRFFKRLVGRAPEPQALPQGALPAAPPEIHLPPEDHIILSKIWEIGLETIVMQTVISLSGDVTTRIQPEYAKESHRMVRDLHQGAVRTSVDFWKTLADIASSLVKTLLGATGRTR